ncbi:amino acid ABC transporter permease [Rhodoferax sp. TH121]|uniref:ABC transporter permease n=1 Tax=Rhodoferax sp. TH121 TaxID=2022803 RepID=UPI000B963E07|nr:ABC transporter permease subunit [Rhodoferax sp. TH121]OYQ38896.1 amino acid ABC transporter permease [Rhodoferax sp. TH121]
MDVLQAYMGQLVQGALMTVQLACAALVCGLVLGLVLAACQLSRHAWLRCPVAMLTGVLRGVPEFLVVLVCYFGLSNLINNHFDSAFDISPFFAGVVSLALVLGAYSSEVFRGSFVALERGQLEAARSLGLSPGQTFFLVRLPQAWRIAIPSLGNLWQSLLKDTSLVSVVGLEDLLKKSNMAAQASHQPFLFLMTAALMYFCLLAISEPLLSALERRAQRPYQAHRS